MKSLVAQFLYHIASNDFTQINNLLEDNCLFINFDGTFLGREKVIKYFKKKLTTFKLHHISILNSVQDSKDTLLISYHMIINQETSPVYGSAVVRIQGNKINYIKNFIVK